MEIECKLKPFARSWYTDGDEPTRQRYGKYHGSYFWGIPGFGREKWVVLLILTGVDIDSHLEEGMSEEEVVDACLRYLNIPVGKRKKKQLYGNLELYRSKNPSWVEGDYKPRFAVKSVEGGGKEITLLAITDVRKNRNFWSKGKQVAGRSRKRKTARKS